MGQALDKWDTGDTPAQRNAAYRRLFDQLREMERGLTELVEDYLRRYGRTDLVASELLLLHDIGRYAKEYHWRNQHSFVLTVGEKRRLRRLRDAGFVAMPEVSPEGSPTLTQAGEEAVTQFTDELERHAKLVMGLHPRPESLAETPEALRGMASLWHDIIRYRL